MVKSGVVLAVTHVLPASEALMGTSACPCAQVTQRCPLSALARATRGSHVVCHARAAAWNRSAARAQCSKAHIVLSYRSGRDFERVAVQPPECMTSAPTGTVQSSGSVSHPSGRATRAGEPCRPRGPFAASGNGTAPSNRSSRAVKFIERLDHRQRSAQLRAGREAVQVPGDVLADIAHALVFAEMRDQQLAVPTNDVGDLTQRGRGEGRTAGERGRQLSEKPGAAQASTADDNAVASGGGHHRQRVAGVVDVAVAEHRDRLHMLLELRDLFPIGGAGVALRRRAGVQGDRGGAFTLRRCGRHRGGCGARRRCRCGT